MSVDDLLATVAKLHRDGFALLIDEIAPDLEAAFREEGASVLAKLQVAADLRKGSRGVVDREAVRYARERGAKLIKDFAQTTPEMLRATLAKAIEEGWSGSRLRDALEENYAFSPARALTIARTETSIARRRGGEVSARSAGARSKHWWVTHDDIDAACMNNQAAGWISIDDDFPEGDEPHPNCTCDKEYRLDEPVEDE